MDLGGLERQVRHAVAGVSVNQAGDVDEDPVLEEKYNELVPVLLDGDEEICHWFLDEEKLKVWLEGKKKPIARA